MTESENKGINRIKIGVRAVALGFILNILLAITKLVAGIVARSVSVFSDAVNNFSDAGVSGVAIFSFLFAGKKADKEHPYGHGRSEYIASFIISLLVIFIAIEILRSSISRLITPTPYTYSTFTVIVLLISVAVKGGMGALYIIRNRVVRSDTLSSSAIDSVADAFTTAIITVCYILGKDMSFPLDGVIGVISSVIIAIGGVKIIIKTVGKLLGRADTGEVEEEIKGLLCEFPEVIGFHDLRVHDYGETNKVASLDAEFDENTPFLTVHNIAYEIERKAVSVYGIDLVVHCDPVPTSNPRYLSLRKTVVSALEQYGVEVSFHELELDEERKIIGLHLCLAPRLMREKERVVYEIRENIMPEWCDYSVKIEYDFI